MFCPDIYFGYHDRIWKIFDWAAQAVPLMPLLGAGGASCITTLASESAFAVTHSALHGEERAGNLNVHWHSGSAGAAIHCRHCCPGQAGARCLKAAARRSSFNTPAV